MRKFYFLFLVMMSFGMLGMAQTPTVLYTSLTSTTPSPSNSRFALTALSGVFNQARFQSNQTAVSGAQSWAFHQGTTSSPDYTNNWRPYTSNNTLSVNNYIPTSFANGAKWNSCSFCGSDGLLPAITSGNYYTFNVTNNATADNIMELLETNYNPVTISSVTPANGTYGSRIITITTSLTPNASENIFVRYSTNSYTSSTIVQATGSGTTWAATIPWQSSAVSFYVYSSNKSLASINSDVTTNGQSAHDMSTLNLNNNGGSNYSWTPASGNIIVSSTGGSFTTPIGYTSLTNASGAFAAINASSAGTAAITILITADVTTEGGTNPLSGSANWTSIGMQPMGARIISGTVSAPLIDLNGADNVTIDGLNTGGNSLTIVNTSVVATASTSTIRFTADATTNIIQNCTINGSATGVAYGTTVTTANVIFGTGTTTGNDGNQILNCDLGANGANYPSQIITSIGTSTAISNDNITITGNKIHDYFNTAGMAGINIGANSSAFTISTNKFYQTVNQTTLASANYSKAIVINTASGGSYVISSNTIGFNSSSGTTGMTNSGGRFTGIELTSVAASPVSSIQGNTINGINWTTASSAATLGAAVFNAIYIAAGGVNIGTTTGNTIGASSGVGTTTSNLYITTTSTGAGIYPIYVTSATPCTISNNNIGGIATGGTAAIGYTFNGIAIAGTAGHTVTLNNVGNATAGSLALGIVGTSTAASTFIGILSSATGAEIIGSSGNPNTIQNIALNAVATNAFTGISNTGAGTTLNINYNIIKGINFGATSATHASTFTGITSSGAVTTAVNINNNSLGISGTGLVSYGLTASSASGALTGISLTGAATATIHSIQNNDFRGITYTSAASGSHTYINITGATAASDVATISGNTFTNLNVNTTGSIVFISHSYTIATTAQCIINNNSIVTGFTKGGAGGTNYCTYTNAVSNSGSINNYTNNNFSNVTLTGATSWVGFNNTDGGSGSVKTITGNTFNSWTTGATGTLNMMNFTYFGTGASSISTNTITNITGQSTITGITIGSTANNATSITVSGNTINNLTSTGTGGSVIGISSSNTSPTINVNNNTINTLSSTASTTISAISISGAATMNIYKNKIYDISGNQTGTIINGVNIISGTTFNIYNNIIGDLRATAATGTNAINGINAGATSTYNVYYNTVYLNATSTSVTTFGNSCITFSSTATSFNFRNNILTNLSTPAQNASNAAANGIAACLRRSGGTGGTVPVNYATTSNNNAYYCNPTAGTNNHETYVEGTSTITNAQNTVANLITFMVNRDQSSIQENPTFTSTTGSNAGFLHISTSGSTPLDGGAAVISGFTDDYDGDTRNASTPDIGADEFTVTAFTLDAGVTNITYAAAPLCSGSQTFTATIKNFGSTTLTSVTFNWALNGGSVTTTSLTGLSLATGATTTTTFSVTLPAGVSANSVQAYTTLPNGSTDLQTSNDSYTASNIYTALSGTYTVGASGANFTSLNATSTAASAVYYANTYGLCGATLFSLTSTYVSTSEVFPITINALSGASSTNTLTVKPAVTGLSISGSSSTGIIVLNGADYVTIDGSVNNTTNTVCPASAATRDLAITNTNTGTSSSVIWMQTTAATDAATNNTIKNCNLTGSGVMQTLFGAGSGSSTISTTSLGTSNNNNSIINNNISGVQYGIYSQGANSGTKNSGTTINQNIITTSANTKGGIWTGFENNITISGNTVSNIAQASSPDVFGITLGFGTGMSSNTSTGNEVTNATVSKNIIGSVVNTGTFSAYGIGVSSATSGTTTISNNMIYGVSANGTSGDFSAGIVLGGGTGSTTNVYFNTVSMQGTITGATAATQTSACLAVTNSTAPTIDLRNNIFSNTQIGNTSATLRFASIALAYSTYSSLTSNNNDLYSTGAGPGTYVIGITGTVVAGTNSTTFGDWQSNTGKDGASVNVLPVFTSTTNLHLSNTSNQLLDGAGTNLSGYTDDIDCIIRNATPDIGADEFTSCATVTASATPDAICVGSGTNVALLASSTNTNYTYAWGAPINASGASQTVSPASTTTYTVTGTDNTTGNTYSGCIVTANVTVTVNPLPIIASSPSYANICTGGSAVLLTGTGAGGGSITETSSTLSVSIPDASSTGVSSTLAVSGIPGAATVDSVIVTFNVTISSYDDDIVVDLEAPNGQIINLVSGVSLPVAAGSNFTNTRITSVTSASALNTGTAPFTGTFKADAITSGFQITPSPAPTTSTFSNLFSTPNGNWKIRVYDDESFVTGTLVDWSIKVAYTGGSTYTWSPSGVGSGLYTDAGATIAYTGGAANSVYAKPSVNTVYTVTGTNSNGCSNTRTATIDIGGLNGTYSVGAGTISGQAGHFSTLTAAVSAYNASCLTGPVIFGLTDATYSSSETFPVSTTANTTASSINTLTIKPNTGVTATITGSVASGALIKILGNYISIDGSNAGSTSQNLTITNTSITSPNTILIGSAGTTPVIYDSLKNCTVINGINLSSAILVSDANTIGNAGYFNNIGIINNNVQKAYIGIYSIAAVSTGNGSGLSITNNTLNTSGANAIRTTGIYLQGIDGATVQSNTVANLETASDENDAGIWLATGTVNTTVSFNTVSNLSYTGTSTTSYGPRAINITSGSSSAGINVSSNTISTIAVSTNGSSTTVAAGIAVSSSTNGVTIAENIVSGITSASSTTTSGIYISSTASGITIERNKLSNIKNTSSAGWGSNGIYLTSTSTTASTVVRNNFIYDIASYGYALGATVTDNGYGIFVNSGAGYSIYYNSVNMNTSQTVAGIPAAINIGSGVTAAGAINMRNNIFANNQTIGGAARYAIYSAAANTVYSSINYNDYYSTGSVGFLTSARTLLIPDWQTATGQDLQSLSVSPGFVSSTDLHLNASSGLDGKATPIAGITGDIDADTRDVSLPDIGADEFIANTTAYYYKTRNSGDWNSVSTWTYCPTQAGVYLNCTTQIPISNALGVEILNSHSVTITSAVSAGNILVDAGATLTQSSGVTFNIANGAGWFNNVNGNDTDFIVSGTYIINGAVPTFASGATAEIRTGGLVKALANTGGLSDDFAGTSTYPNVVFKTGSVFEWNTSAFGSSNTTYFLSGGAEKPIFRVTANTGSVGASTTTTFNGKFEVSATGSITFQNSGTKIFRDGFGGTSPGSITHKGGSIAADNASGPFQITGTTAVIDGTVILNLQNNSFAVNNELQIPAGTSVTISGAPVINVGTSLFTGSDLAIDGTLLHNGTAAIDLTYGSLTVSGDLSSSSTGSFKANSASTSITDISFTGTGTNPTNTAQLTFSSGFGHIRNLSLNRSAAATRVNIGGDMTINNNLSLLKGILVTGNNLITWANSGGTYTLPTAYTDSWIATCDATGTTLSATNGTKGFRINNIGSSSGNIFFPVGATYSNSGSGFAATPNRMMINNSGATDFFTVVVGKGDIGNSPKPRVNRIWYVTEGSTGASEVSMRLYFTKRNWAGTWPSVEDEVESGFLWGDVHLIQENTINQFLDNSNGTDVSGIDYTAGTYDNTEIWAQLNKGVGININGSANTDGITQFTRFGVVNAAGIILPVTITNLRAWLQNNAVELSWTSVSEINIDHYEIERSGNGIGFSGIGSRPALNNGSIQTDYAFSDLHPQSGKNYYRIKVVEKDGHINYTNVVLIETTGGTIQITVAPNPVINKKVILQFVNAPEGKYNLILHSTNGQKVWQSSLLHLGGSSGYYMRLPASLAEGIYFMHVENAAVQQVIKLVVQ